MLIQLVRLGHDAVTRCTPAGTPLIEFNGAYDIGFGESKRTQWITCVGWGERWEKLAEHLTKGKQVQVAATDVELERWERKDGGGQGAKLKCKLVHLEFAGNNSNTPGNAASNDGGNNQENAGNGSQQQQPPANFDNFDDDIPF